MNFAVIDVGGTFIKYACMNENADIISRGKVPTPMTGRDDFIDTIVKIYHSMNDIKAVAISAFAYVMLIFLIAAIKS